MQTSEIVDDEDEELDMSAQVIDENYVLLNVMVGAEMVILFVSSLF